MKLTRTAIAVAGFAAAGALLLPATASADPLTDNALLDSTCSFAQVDAALHDRAPEAAQRLDANPGIKSQVQQAWDRPIPERKAIFQQFLNNNPDARDRAQSDPRSGEFFAKAQEIADTCHSY